MNPSPVNTSTSTPSARQSPQHPLNKSDLPAAAKRTSPPPLSSSTAASIFSTHISASSNSKQMLHSTPPDSNPSPVSRESGHNSSTQVNNNVSSTTGSRRRTGRPTTPGEPSHNLPSSPLSRRNSILSDISVQDATSAIKTTTEQVLVSTGSETSTWHSIPLAFAVLPAIGGVLFTGGSAFISDIMLLFLIAVFLHWLVKFPWEWYHISQTRKYEQEASETLSRAAENPHVGEEPAAEDSPAVKQLREEATRELEMNENMALVACFLGPCIGGWLLHAVRSQLSRPSEGLISNFNLSIFVLIAELRPAAHVVKMVRSRNHYLQSIVHHQPPTTKLDTLAAKLEALQAEVKELTLLTAKAVERDPDLDALNRAVRRYEKKEALHSIQTENRILEIDNRLNDVLTLAAAASAQQHRNAFSMIIFEWMCAVIVIPLSVAWKIVSLPARAVETVAGLRSRLLLQEGHRQQHRSKPRQKNLKSKS